MLRSRIVIAGAVFALAAGSAAAQTATSGAPGKPLSLSQVAGQTAKPTIHAHPARKLAAHMPAKRRLAEHAPRKLHRVAAAAAPAAQPTPQQVQSTAPAVPANVWPAADTAAPGPALAPAAPAGNVTTEHVVDTTQNDVVVDGHPMQVASPAGLATVDHVAEETTGTAKAAAPSNPAPPAPAVHAMAFSPTLDEPSHVWSASWIAQVLAALGGAIAAGIVAWFLILPGSPRDAATDDEWAEAKDWAEAEGA